MRRFNVCAASVAALLVLTVPRSADAQGRVVPAPDPGQESVRAPLSPRYGAGELHRFSFGDGWRDLWDDTLQLPVLNIATFGGGLRPEREGGGRQSITLHMIDADGRGWVFRSLDKYPSEKLADDLQGTLAGDVIQDNIARHHPTGALVIPPLLGALDILHVVPRLYVMPDDPALGEHRETFAGMIGMLEEKPHEGADGTPGTSGTGEVLETDELLERLEESPFDAVAQNELLRSRLVDFIVGDVDRTMDNYDWASFGHAGGTGRIWRPIPRDRDWAFLRADGAATRLTQQLASPSLAQFGPRHSPLAVHTAGAHVVDRRLLNALDRNAFRREVLLVQTRLTDDVIEAAVDRLPVEHGEEHRHTVAEAMKARRDALTDIADAYYAWLAGAVDVHVSNAGEVAEVERHADGTVTVRVEPRDAAVLPATVSEGQDGSGPTVRPSYQRRFLPGETGEVRLFMRGGNDTVAVRGAGGAITLRVIGGAGDDALVDASTGAGVHFYDAEGGNRIRRSGGTHVAAREWRDPEPSEDLHRQDWPPDWGGRRGLGFTAHHEETVGFIVGTGPKWTSYGFRRYPYHWQVSAYALSGVTTFSPGAELRADYRFEAVPHSIELDLYWTTFDAFRWFGPGNDSERLEGTLSLVEMDRVSIEPAFVWRFGQWLPEFVDDADDEADDEKLESGMLSREPVPVPFRVALSLGPSLRYSSTSAPAGSPLDRMRPAGYGSLWQVGASARAEIRRADREMVPRRGYRLRAALSGYPGVATEPGPSATASAELNGYVPLIGDGPHLALRVGGARAFGDFPVFDAATVGGRRSLRGYSSRRFAGDAAAFAGAELRIPLADLPLIAPGKVGVFGLVDAARVWNDGESPGGWHSGRGGGLWVEAFRHSASIAYVTGERSRLYVWYGMPF